MKPDALPSDVTRIIEVHKCRFLGYKMLSSIAFSQNLSALIVCVLGFHIKSVKRKKEKSHENGDEWW